MTAPVKTLFLYQSFLLNRPALGGNVSEQPKIAML
jgi:hypothetical protein